MSPPLLPELPDRTAYERLYADDAVWWPAAEALCARHDLPVGQLRRATLGSNPVFRVGDVFLKLYPPFEPECGAELAGLRGAAGLPVPRVLHTGALEGWPYALLSVVAGEPALKVWPWLSTTQRRVVAGQLGRLLRRLHACEPPADLPGDWEAFLARRLHGAVAHHGVDGDWRAWIARRLQEFQCSQRPEVLLHADITADHVLLEPAGTGWRICGLIDFGDARAGHPFYDLVAPLAFYAFGDPGVATALLAGYGLEATAAVQAELTTWCLLHEFGRLQDFLDRHPAADGAEFERALWGDG